LFYFNVRRSSREANVGSKTSSEAVMQLLPGRPGFETKKKGGQSERRKKQEEQRNELIPLERVTK
jgi:hypothetical protein